MVDAVLVPVLVVMMKVFLNCATASAGPVTTTRWVTWLGMVVFREG